MTIKISDIIILLKNYGRNQSLTDERAIPIIDSAADYVFSQMGVPGQEKEYTFDFFEDQPAYSLPADFGEEIYLRYEDDELNRNQSFSWRPGELLFQRIKTVSAWTMLFGSYVAAGIWQLFVLAKNSVAGAVLDTFDNNNDTNWIPSEDATNVTTDAFTKKEGQASLKFDVNVTLSGLHRASLTRTIQVTDLSTMRDLAHFKCWVYLPTITNFTSISFNWGNDASKYFKQTVMTQEDGSAFVVGWNKIDFIWLGATLVGSVNTQQITYLKFDFDYAAGFTSVNNFRIDFLRVLIPDKMILTYYTTNKGKTSLGAAIQVFTATTDEFLFGSFDPALKQLIAVQAAVILNPQILVEDESVKRIYNDFYKVFVRRFPRKRIKNLLFDPKVAKTSEQF